MTYRKLFALATLTVSMTLPACGGEGWEPKTPDGAEARTAHDDAVDAVGALEQEDPSIRRFFEEAHAFAIYPTVGKGGACLGGAYGRGLVYRGGRLIGTTSVTQVTAGFQLGGQAYSEVVFFEDEAALANFTEGNLELGAQASAVAITAGAAANASYAAGVAIFTAPKGGLMYEASVAGQAFSFDPVEDRS